MYGESDIYPELVYSVAAQQIREQQWEEQQRRARRDGRARRVARLRAVLRLGGPDL
ncbi:MAG TPA: hypothetical protein VKB37_11775 [Jatrophihabitantaceae bacterium]|nr:hypothetical protein [Jatrophihabitantaceae bacterium]